MRRRSPRQRRLDGDSAAERFAALHRVGTALVSELDQERLLYLIATTARDLTGAESAAFSLRPVNEQGQLLVPSEGNLFHLAAVVGVTTAQEELFRRMPLGGEGLLAPIFRHGVPVRVPDALSLLHTPEHGRRSALRDEAQEVASAYAHGDLPSTSLRSMGVPHGHPSVRSFLGVPLLDRSGDVRGGLLLGHGEPDRFTAEDERLLVALAAQAAVAVENARLYRAAQTHAQELDAIFESITDGIILVDSKGNIVRENATARRLRRLLESRPEGTSLLFPLLQASPARATVEEDEQGTLLTITDNNDETKQYLVHTLPVRQPRPPSGPLEEQEHPHNGERDSKQQPVSGAVIVWHDVTEARRLIIERRAHAETESRRKLLQIIIDELPSGVFLVRGNNARLVLVNRAAVDVFGAPWQEDQPMVSFLSMRGIQLFGSDGHQLTPDELATLRALRSGEAVRHYQEIIRRSDGTTLPVLLNAVAIDPRILGWTSKQLNEENDKLEAVAVVALHDVTALKEAEQLKDEFIGIAAHELRNPLAALKGFAQMLITQTAHGKGPPLADWQIEAIEALDQATTRLVGLTEDLLDMTRLQAGLLELYPSPTELGMLVTRVVARLRVLSASHSLVVHTPAEHVIVDIDPQRIEQVLINLVNNAVKYSPEGGVINITIMLHDATRTAQVSVRDEGMGIPQSQQASIFGRFVRADNVRAHGITGTGLGLYLCRELIWRHGGRIWFKSVENEGSTFFFELPLALPLDKS